MTEAAGGDNVPRDDTNTIIFKGIIILILILILLSWGRVRGLFDWFLDWLDTRTKSVKLLAATIGIAVLMGLGALLLAYFHRNFAILWLFFSIFLIRKALEFLRNHKIEITDIMEALRSNSVEFMRVRLLDVREKQVEEREKQVQELKKQLWEREHLLWERRMQLREREMQLREREMQLEELKEHEMQL